VVTGEVTSFCCTVFDTGDEKNDFVSLGDKDWFYVQGHTNFRSQGSSNEKLSSETGMYLDVYIFNEKKTIFEIENTGETTNEDTYSYDFGLCLIKLSDGCLVEKNEEHSGRYSGDRLILFTYEPDISELKKMVYKTIWVGPIPVKVGLGVSVDPTIKYLQISGTDYDRATIDALVDVDALASAEVDAIIASATIDAELTLAELGLTTDQEVAMTGDEDDMDNRYYEAYHTGNWDANFLDGDVDLTIKIYNPFGKDAKYKYELVEWDGWSYEGELFDERTYEQQVWEDYE